MPSFSNLRLVEVPDGGVVAIRVAPRGGISPGGWSMLFCLSKLLLSKTNFEDFCILPLTNFEIFEKILVLNKIPFVVTLRLTWRSPRVWACVLAWASSWFPQKFWWFNILTDFKIFDIFQSLSNPFQIPFLVTRIAIKDNFLVLQRIKVCEFLNLFVL